MPRTCCAAVPVARTRAPMSRSVTIRSRRSTTCPRWRRGTTSRCASCSALAGAPRPARPTRADGNTAKMAAGDGNAGICSV